MHSCVQQWLARALTDKEKAIIEKACYVQFFVSGKIHVTSNKNVLSFLHNNSKNSMTVYTTVFATITSTQFHTTMTAPTLN